ncbi:hypothetical protein [Pseudomonas chlororaphis]|uniref:hypothetical protein n=1 Tax=Pseudomonas chlororaphis TaxID=587753 RepID=UPI0024081983|nr:hypothetical protein [Pseudomonas chlororaphis]
MSNNEMVIVPLLPCPFCGKSARFVPADYIDNNGEPWPFAECDPCNVGAPVEFWNKRAEQHQGEPVAPFYICVEDRNRLVRDDIAIASVRVSRQKRGAFTEPLYTSPPAPVAVVLPRDADKAFKEWASALPSPPSAFYAYLAGIAEVARLNSL